MEIRPDAFGHSSPRSMEWMHFITVLHDFGFSFAFWGDDKTIGLLVNRENGQQFSTPAWVHPSHADRLRATRNWVVSWFEGYVFGKFDINTEELPRQGGFR